MNTAPQSVKIMRMRDLPEKVNLKPSTIYSLIAQKKFPAPFKFVPGGRAAGWFEKTIDDWLLERLEKKEQFEVMFTLLRTFSEKIIFFIF